MQVSSPNNIKIYNLSAGRSLPDWLSEQKRRKLQKQDVNVHKKIELIQDFDMPILSSNIQMTPDGQSILATGIYKPRVRCYDVNHMSMKFDRCMDAEVSKFMVLSEDYSKLVFLHNDRYVEFHARQGKYYLTRIPKLGRDFSYHYPSCDLFLVGASSDIWRLNLEQGRFLNSLVSDAHGFNCCEMNKEHGLLVCGSDAGRIEAWDPRSRLRVGTLDCALSSVTQDTQVKGLPAVTSLKYKDGLTLGVGMSTGQVLLYDIRSDKPLLVKDHMYGLPIKSMHFHKSSDLVLSMDSRILKIWEEKTGKPYTSVEGTADLNDLCVVPNSGLFFMANEDKKILTYYIPALGPAPRWCSFLDSLTEELEESQYQAIYDDYKFVTKKELEDLELGHLIGSDLVRGYMHGYFMDMRLYHKAKSVAKPFAFNEYKKNVIKSKIDAERKNRVQIQKLPSVNPDFFSNMKGKKTGEGLLEDNRFKAMFEETAFEIDKQAPEFKTLHPHEAKKSKKDRKQEKISKSEEKEEVEEPEMESDSDFSSDEELIGRTKMSIRSKRQKADREAKIQPKFYEIKEGQNFNTKGEKKKKTSKSSLGERVVKEDLEAPVQRLDGGNRELEFTVKKDSSIRRREAESREHHQLRKKVRRSAQSLMGKPKARFYKGQRVKD